VNDLRKVLAERLRQKRESLELTQGELARSAGFAVPQMISQIEKGERDVKAWELFNLAKALHTDVSCLLEVNEDSAQPVVLWRKSPDGPQRKQKEAEFLRRCRDYRLVETLCEEGPGRSLPAAGGGNLTLRMAVGLGEDTARKLALGSRPARSLASVLEDKYGVKIWYQRLGENGSAACTKAGFGPAILVNADEAPWRRNYSFAHELFHLMTWDSATRRAPDGGREVPARVEKLADAFASALVLPETELRTALTHRTPGDKISYDGLIDVAREFDVSTAALLWRLANMGAVEVKTVQAVLEDPKYKSLDRSHRVGSWGLPPELPERYVRLAYLSFKMGKLSRSRLAELLDVSLVDLTERLAEYELDDTAGHEVPVLPIRR